MRITNNMMVNDLTKNLNTNLQKMDELQRQLATGKRINMPSDDPAGLVKSLRLRSGLTEGKQYLKNINDAISFMDTTDSALYNINELVQKIRELTVQAATGTNNSEANQAIATQIAELNDQLKMIANTTYGSKHIFAGTNVTEIPYQDGQWTGNEEVLQIEIGQGVEASQNITKMKEFFMGRLNDLQIDTDLSGVSKSGIQKLSAQNLQEGAYQIKTAVGAASKSTVQETQSYLGSLSNNGKFFYQSNNSSAELGVGKDSTALDNNSAYSGSLIIESKKVTLSQPKCTFGSGSGNITFDEAIYCKDDAGDLKAITSGSSDFKSRLTYTSSGNGKLYSAQYSTDASGAATINFETEDAQDGDTIVWNDDQGGTAGSGAGKAYDKEGNAFPAITFKFNGTSNQWEYSGTTIPAQVSADIKGHVYSSTGEYKYVELTNVQLNMETGAGKELFKIDKSKLWGTDDLVVYNAGDIALGGVDPTNPEIKAGDKAILSFSGQATAADTQKVDIDYQYTDLNDAKIGEGSHSYVFENGALDNKTQDLKFFTLNVKTGLSYDGSISAQTATLTADDAAASFSYQAGLFDYVEDLTRKVQVGKLPEVGDELEGADIRLNEILLHQATIGARINRLELQQDRLNDTQESLTGLLAVNEDANEAEVIMNMKAQENVYNASLAVGARIIQPTLIDFLS